MSHLVEHSTERPLGLDVPGPTSRFRGHLTPRPPPRNGPQGVQRLLEAPSTCDVTPRQPQV